MRNALTKTLFCLAVAAAAGPAPEARADKIDCYGYNPIFTLRGTGDEITFRDKRNKPTIVTEYTETRELPIVGQDPAAARQYRLKNGDEEAVLIVKRAPGRGCRQDGEDDPQEFEGIFVRGEEIIFGCCTAKDE